MGIKNKGAFKRSWFVLVDKSYTDMYQRVAGFRISATRSELVDLLRDFKEKYPDAHITVMKS